MRARFVVVSAGVMDRPKLAHLPGLQPGWQQRRMENFTALVGGTILEEDLVGDGWTAEALKPRYNRFCKWPCFHDDCLPTFNRLNVTLVDTQGRGVERITENGVIANGCEYQLDCLIYSTGYDASSPFAERISFEILGRGGLTLKENWAKGASSFHGYGTHGFSNLFIMAHVQTGLSLNFSHMIGEQARHIAHILREARVGRGPHRGYPADRSGMGRRGRPRRPLDGRSATRMYAELLQSRRRR
ncbi:MAG TPA: hypothetical protein VF503_29535 [Sphingobium sp.]|uniref:hypothetical protein n=1 Tax=Sphingobium sp. TaxID=1912891 RepID=UPI002ED1503B